MRIQEFLSENRTELLEGWIGYALTSYSSDFSRFFKKNSDPFTNPMGYNITKSLSSLFDILSGARDDSGLDSFLDDIVRVRAIQDMTPSQSLSFFPRIKTLVRERARERDCMDTIAGDLEALDNQIDDMMFRSFDAYMKCREQIFQIKVGEITRGTFMDVPSGASCPSTLMDSWSSKC